jgi:hypothetical protein
LRYPYNGNVNKKKTKTKIAENHSVQGLLKIVIDAVVVLEELEICFSFGRDVMDPPWSSLDLAGPFVFSSLYH